MAGKAQDNTQANDEGEQLRLRALLISIIGFNIIVLSAVVYGMAGTDLDIGEYLGYPVPYYVPIRVAVPVSLSLLIVGLLVHFLSPSLSRIGGRAVAAIKWLVVALAVISSAAIAMSISRGRVLLSGGREDSYVIQVAAAHLLIMGKDPYSVNYSPYLISETSIAKLTLVYSQGPPFSASHVIGYVHYLDYPAFAFLYYVPAELLRLHPVVWDSLVLGLSLGLLYSRLRGTARDLFPLVLAVGAFYIISDPMTFDPIVGWLAPLIVAVSFLEYPTVVGAMIALSASYREYAIAEAFVYFPMAARMGLRVRRGIASMIAVGAALNLPFLILTPHRFLEDLLLPAALRLDLEGFGVASLYFYGVRLSKDLLDAAVVATLIVTAVISYYFYSYLGALSLSLPALAFLLYPRPLYSYWLWFPLLGILGLLRGLSGEERPANYVRLVAYQSLALSASAVVMSSVVGGFIQGVLYYVDILPPLVSLVALLASARRLSEKADAALLTSLLVGGLGAVSWLASRRLASPVLEVLGPASLSMLKGGLVPELGMSFMRYVEPYAASWPTVRLGLPSLWPMAFLPLALVSAAALLLSSSDIGLLALASISDALVMLTSPLGHLQEAWLLTLLPAVAYLMGSGRPSTGRLLSLALGLSLPAAPQAATLLSYLADDKGFRPSYAAAGLVVAIITFGALWLGSGLTPLSLALTALAIALELFLGGFLRRLGLGPGPTLVAGSLPLAVFPGAEASVVASLLAMLVLISRGIDGLPALKTDVGSLTKAN